jgi:ribosomal-protein-alanine N-acetyltransferase
MNEPIEIIATERLVLRTPLSSDLGVLYEHVISDSEVMRHAFAGRPFSSAETAKFFDEQFDHGGSGRKLGVLVERPSAAVIGFAGLLPCDVLGEADYEIGFVLRRSAWRRGYGTEIGFAQLNYGFNALDCRRLLAQASPENRASIATLRKLGMHFHSAVDNEERGNRLLKPRARPAGPMSVDGCRADRRSCRAGLRIIPRRFAGGSSAMVNDQEGPWV